MANKVKKRIIAYPYNWEWNRMPVPSFITTDGVDEYPITVMDLGWLERGYCEVYADTTDPKTRYIMETKRSLPRASRKADPPGQVALDIDKNGQQVLRFGVIPNATVYEIFLDYQRKPTRMTALTGTEGLFAPIPDEMEDVLSEMFLAMAYEAVDDKRSREKLQIAEALLQRYLAYSDMEESPFGFVPDRELFMG
jgi:hypothetical protein